MIKRNLVILGLLSLGMITMSGCAQKIAKQDEPAPPAAAAAPSGDSTQAQTAAADSTTAPAAETAATPETPSASATALPNPLSDGAAPAAVASATVTQDAAATKAKDDAAAKQAAVTLLPLPSQEVMDTIKKMTHHPRVRYLSRTAQYDYYVGGRLEAKYDINKSQFIIKDKNAADPDAVTCEYSNDGKMISESKSTPSKVISECNNLVSELGTYLSR
jgi:predicted lipid-binding transport protein (Tim44 family)